MKLTTQKLHRIIQSEIGQKSSKYSVSQKIDRTTYHVSMIMKGKYGILSTCFAKEIKKSLNNNGISFTETKGIIIVPINQNI